MAEKHMIAVSEIADLNPHAVSGHKSGDVSFLPMAAVSENGFDYEDIVVAAEELGNGYTPFREGDILISKITPCFENGKTAHLTRLKQSLGYGSTEFHVVRPQSAVDSRYLYAHFRDDRFRKYGETNMRGSAGQKRVPAEFISEWEIYFPPLPEQRRIAAILGEWDQAITTAEKLVGVKRQQRDWLTGDLINTNDRRAMSGLADIVFSTVDKKTASDEIEVHVCNYMHVLRNRALTNSLRFDAGSATPQEIARFSLRPGDVVFTKDSEIAEEIAEVSVVMEPLDNVVCGYHLAVARPREGVAVGRYVAHALRNPAIRNEFVTRVNGAIRFGLTMETMDQIEIPLPSVETQFRVADILDGADFEIATLSKCIDQLRLQKRGLMQKLLSGDWPVPASIDRLLPGGLNIDEAVGAETKRAETTG